MDFLLDIVLSKPGLLISGIVLGVVFDEFFTTKFAWLKQEGREVMRDLKLKI